jgi:hypothetical protein
MTISTTPPPVPEWPSAEPAAPSRRWSTYWPLILVAVTVLVNLWVLRSERLVVTAVNDQSVHRLLIEWARANWAQGVVPFDGWFPRLSAGLPEFHHYQVLPHILTGLVATVVGPDHAVAWTNYLGMALWPVCIYLTVRLFGFSRTTAGLTAAMAPLISSVTLYGFEYGSYNWRGNGMWSQLWGMWLLPLTLALTFRAVTRGHRYALAALFLALTLSCHFLTGLMAIIGMGIWVLLAPREIPRRIGRAALVGIGGLAGASWLLVPVTTDAAYGISSQYNGGTYFFDSHGRSTVFSWLWRGDLLDHAQDGRLRWPLITVLLGVGLVLAIVRFTRDERLRGLLLYFALGFAFFAGKDTVGWLTSRLPGSDQLLLHRFHNMVQISGLILAGVGASFLAQGLWRWVTRSVTARTDVAVEPPAEVPDDERAASTPNATRRAVAVLGRNPVAAVLATVVVVAFVAVSYGQAWDERNTYMRLNGAWVDAQRAADAGPGEDFASLVDEASTFGGRVYSGSASANSPYKILYAPTYMALAHLDADAIGFTLRTLSLTGDAEVKFNDQLPQHVDLFNVRAMILPSGVSPAPALGAELVRTRGAWNLWSVPTTGYLEAVDTGPAIVATNQNLGVATTDFMTNGSGADGVFPLIAFAGKPSGPPTRFDGTALTTPPGTVTVQYDRPADGKFGGRVEMDRDGVVMLKATYDPRWVATVDGERVETQMIAPSFVGVPVPAGEHTVQFTYEKYPYSWPLLVLGVLVLLGLAVAPRVLDLRRTRTRDAWPRIDA